MQTRLANKPILDDAMPSMVPCLQAAEGGRKHEKLDGHFNQRPVATIEYPGAMPKSPESAEGGSKERGHANTTRR